MSTVFVCLDATPPASPAACVEYVAVDYEPSPFSLDLEAAGQIATATALVWAAAWAVRVVARMLRNS